MPKLSIIVPVYNSEKYLKKCLLSIQQSTFTDFECIIIDDGSTDRSYVIAEAFSLDDKRFKPIRKYNQGVSVARNIGLFLSKGEWVTFCDSDDYIEKDKYQEMLSAAIIYDSPIVQCDINVYTEDDNFKKVWSLGDKSEKNIYEISDRRIFSDVKYDIGHCWDKIYRKDILDGLYFPPDISMCEDTLFNINAFFRSGKIYALHKRLHNYIERENSLAHKKLIKDDLILLKNNVKDQLTDLEMNKWYDYYKDNIENLFNNIYKRYDFIDYVFLYVDCSKKDWQKQYISYTKNNIDSQRFAAREEFLKYKFRSLEMWAPWIDNVYMIVSDETQVPEWVNRYNVKIIYHKDFIPQKYLPTFNSCTIEMFLHNISDLSEKFIYSNDDILMNDILKSKFFFKDDKIKMNLFNRKLYHQDDIKKIWAQIPINSLKLAAKDTPEYLEKYIDGVHLYEPAHIDKPMLKSNNKYVYELYKNKIENSITQERSSKNYNQFLFTEYAMFHDKALWETYRFEYFQVGKDTDKIVKAIKTKDNRPREICCNDTEIATANDYERIYDELEFLYPNKSKYEN